MADQIATDQTHLESRESFNNIFLCSFVFSLYALEAYITSVPKWLRVSVCIRGCLVFEWNNFMFFFLLFILYIEKENSCMCRMYGCVWYLSFNLHIGISLDCCFSEILIDYATPQASRDSVEWVIYIARTSPVPVCMIMYLYIPSSTGTSNTVY